MRSAPLTTLPTERLVVSSTCKRCSAHKRGVKRRHQDKREMEVSVIWLKLKTDESAIATKHQMGRKEEDNDLK